MLNVRTIFEYGQEVIIEAMLADEQFQTAMANGRFYKWEPGNKADRPVLAGRNEYGIEVWDINCPIKVSKRSTLSSTSKFIGILLN